MVEAMTLGEILFGGAIAGFTIYLGLPIARLTTGKTLRVFLNAVSVGILLFLFVEISYQVIERIEALLKLGVVGYADPSELVTFLLLFIGGFAGALFGLVWFERRFVHTSPETASSLQNGGDQPFNPKKTAVMIAVGIGLHNFSEGLVIGQSFAGGSISLGLLLVVGFALHNGTEGFGIAGPLSGYRPPWRFLLLLGLIGGGPTLVGTYLGTFWIEERIEILFLALAAGAILYIVGELIHLGKLEGQHLATTYGLLVGFFLAFGSDLIIERAMAGSLEKQASNHVIEMEVGEFYFRPDEIHLKAGQPVKLLITNRGQAEHEIEIFGKGITLEELIPYGGTIPVYLNPLYPGTIPFLCDMPGHLMGGMKGRLIIEEPL